MVMDVGGMVHFFLNPTKITMGSLGSPEGEKGVRRKGSDLKLTNDNLLFNLLKLFMVIGARILDSKRACHKRLFALFIIVVNFKDLTLLSFGKIDLTILY